MIPFACAAALLFTADSAVHLAAVANRRETLRRVTKLLLMPLLALTFCLFWTSLSPESVPWLVVAALALGFGGDAFLLDRHFSPGLPLGLACFFAGHVLYMIQIWCLTPAPSWRAAVLVPLVYAAVAVLFYRKLYPHLPGKYRIPALAYTLMLCALSSSAVMSAFSLHIGSTIVLAGTLLFMLSDSILSFEVFRGESRHGNVKVMSSYIAAQACLSAGFLVWMA